MDRKAKEQIVSELQEKLKKAHLGVLTRFNAMNVEKMEALRNALQNDAELKVSKHLLGIASRIFHSGGSLSIRPVVLLSGSGGADKGARGFAKKNPELDIKVGVLDGKMLTRRHRRAGCLPSREVLLGKLVSVMAAVPTSLVTVLSAVPRGFVQALHAYSEKKQTLNS